MYYPRIKNKDSHYFDVIDTQEKAYFLGLLYADGCVNNQGFAISLKKEDRRLLERFSIAIYGEVRLKDKPSTARFIRGVPVHSSGSYLLYVSGRHLSESLIKLGAIPAKSLILRFPTSDQVPNHLLHHFIRGYFDGDGCISSRVQNGGLRHRVNIASSESFCRALSERMHLLLDINFTVRRTHSKIHYAELGGSRQVKTFMDWIHKGATISLDRKRLRYEALVADIERRDEKTKGNWSRYTNIIFHKEANLWSAAVRENGKTRRLKGCFKTEEEAYAHQQDYLNKTGLINNGGVKSIRRVEAKLALFAHKA